eukprot:RCo040243
MALLSGRAARLAGCSLLSQWWRLQQPGCPRMAPSFSSASRTSSMTGVVDFSGGQHVDSTEKRPLSVAVTYLHRARGGRLVYSLECTRVRRFGGGSWAGHRTLAQLHALQQHVRESLGAQPYAMWFEVA